MLNAKYFEVQKKEKERERYRKIGNKKHKGRREMKRKNGRKKRIEGKTERGE